MTAPQRELIDKCWHLLAKISEGQFEFQADVLRKALLRAGCQPARFAAALDYVYEKECAKES